MPSIQINYIGTIKGNSDANGDTKFVLKIVHSDGCSLCIEFTTSITLLKSFLDKYSNNINCLFGRKLFGYYGYDMIKCIDGVISINIGDTYGEHDKFILSSMFQAKLIECLESLHNDWSQNKNKYVSKEIK